METTNISLAVATLVEEIPVATVIVEPSENIDFSQFELREDDYN